VPEPTSIDNLAQSIAEAEQLFDQNELEAAEAIAKRVLEQDSANARGMQVLGMIHARCDRPNEAIPLLERALAIQPDLTGAHNDLGMSYEQLGNTHQALVHFERALIL
jgi:protein O-GlcNAc transferase